ncbi:hypothetical protein SUGI_1094520 [Cryptomeria japonica]|nr:hypothetical protein SUGI_1094520 [Cryptomeria japonica]
MSVVTAQCVRRNAKRAQVELISGFAWKVPFIGSPSVGAFYEINRICMGRIYESKLPGVKRRQFAECLEEMVAIAYG